MSDYQRAPAQMRFTLEHLADLREVAALPDFESASTRPRRAVLEEAAKFASGVLAPVNALGDREGVSVRDDAAVVPQEFTDAFAAFARRWLDRDRGKPGIRRPGAAQDGRRWPARRCGTARTWRSRSVRS